MKVYLMCPVRRATNEVKAFLGRYVEALETLGVEVFYPGRDNPYEDSDPIGDKISKANMNAIIDSDEVHIYWDESSAGSKFDLGIAFAFEKPIVIINNFPESEGKSFNNLLIFWPYGVEFIKSEEG